jgi:hypothetical protein
LNEQEWKPYEACLQLATIVIEHSDHPVDLKSCDNLIPEPRPVTNLAAGVVAAGAFSYLVQLIYYKVVLYVVLGDKARLGLDG